MTNLAHHSPIYLVSQIHVNHYRYEHTHASLQCQSSVIHILYLGYYEFRSPPSQISLAYLPIFVCLVVKIHISKNIINSYVVIKYVIALRLVANIHISKIHSKLLFSDKIRNSFKSIDSNNIYDSKIYLLKQLFLILYKILNENRNCLQTGQSFNFCPSYSGFCIFFLLQRLKYCLIEHKFYNYMLQSNLGNIYLILIFYLVNKQI